MAPWELVISKLVNADDTLSDVPPELLAADDDEYDAARAVVGNVVAARNALWEAIRTARIAHCEALAMRQEEAMRE